jgi:hypothetical protein
MHTIIAGRVETQERAEQLIGALQGKGLALDDMQAFFVNPPGMHAAFPVGGDTDIGKGTAEAGAGQAKGVALGAVAGLAAGGVAAVAVPPLAPVLAVALTGVGAHVGGLAGALSSTRDPREQKPEGSEEADETGPPQSTDIRRGGMMLAVRVTDRTEPIVIEAMRTAGVQDIERARGRWDDGQWLDFDPLSTPQKIGDRTEPAASTQ